MRASVKELKDFLLWCRANGIVLHELDWQGVRLAMSDPAAVPKHEAKVDTTDSDALEMLKQYALPAYLAMTSTQSQSKEPGDG